ncbi:aspartate/glutamate racemase family protein [Polymorphum gilvum]|uniref:Arylmalonate decarboxylase n=1 Tax=Polymorphum gilvum (strain LMG 25793 / CGMCC 1.9160 / SL003B-26A1) TaxID=991905 RepID=F2IXG8_POLGS|nr:aspartate/glutamate racemase family protein [Polymorphum gilvum]ADZ71591.1 Arylmalonate decarboxylase [Polymorphum gilvum SL003B-26A1]
MTSRPGDGRPLVGLIVPPATGLVPPEPPALYGDALRFAARGLALATMTRDGYDDVIDRVEAAARALAAEGAAAVALMGTSLSFYRGAAFNDALVERMASATGLPVTTMSCAVVEALRAVGARRLAVATAYVDEVNDRLTAFLLHHGFEVLGLDSLQISAVGDVLAIGDDDLIGLGTRAFVAAPEADALLVSCGGLQTLSVTLPLEDRLGVPVISSAVAGAWAAARLIGHGGEAPGYGRLLETAPKSE